MNGNLASSGFKNETVHFNDIADIPFFELGVFFLAYIVHADIDLYPAHLILNIYEICLAHIAPGHDPAADRYILALKRVIIVFDLFAFVGLGGSSNLERVFSGILQGFKLVHTNLSQLVFREHDFSHCHGSRIRVVAYEFYIFKSLFLRDSAACAGNCACLKKERVFNFISVCFNKILGICFFFLILKRVLHLHTAVLLYSLDSTPALVLFLKNG